MSARPSGTEPDPRPSAEAADGRAERRAPEPAVLPQRSRDEQDEGWGDQPTSEDRDADWYQRERPPHHGD